MLALGNSGPVPALTAPSPGVGELPTLVGVDVVPVVVADEWGSGDTLCLSALGRWADLCSGMDGIE